MSDPQIPKTQTAAVLPASGATSTSRLEIRHDKPIPSPAAGEILVKLEFSGVCHSDVHSVRGETPMLTDVVGHEGVGKVVKVGDGLKEGHWMGKRVGIRWLYSSCLECEICERNNTACPYQKNAGANVPGTFQQYIVSPAVHVTKIPAELSPDEAAPLLCAGIAMYSSIIKTKTRPGDWIVLPGAGGGLGHMGVQIAAKKGLKIIAIDSGEKKKQLSLSLGATAFLDYKVDDVEGAVKQLTSGLGAHAVICTANSEAAYKQSMRLLRRLGVLVCVGIPNVPFRLPATPFDMIVKGLTIVGNSAGTAHEMDELMTMAVAGEVKAHIECYEFDQIDNVIQRLGNSEIDGRAVMRIPE
ncbi:chaperonin 10-like protein [Aspergillus crustosus]